MIKGLRLAVVLLATLFVITCVDAQELSAKEHLEVARKLLGQNAGKSISKSEQQMTIQHIKTAIFLGLNYQEKAQASLLLATHATSVELTADEHFQVGKTLIEANNYDSHGASQGGMEQGILQMKEAIRLNCSDIKRAQIILARAYDQMPVAPAINSDADRKRVVERDQVLYQLYLRHPDDLEVLDIYANRVSAREDKVRAYSRMIELNPKLPDPHVMLGLFLIQDGKLTAGIAEGKRAIELEVDPSVVGDRASMFVQAITAQGCAVPGSDDWGMKMSDAISNLDIGTHSNKEVIEARRRFEKVRKDFLMALGKVACPNVSGLGRD